MRIFLLAAVCLSFVVPGTSLAAKKRGGKKAAAAAAAAEQSPPPSAAEAAAPADGAGAAGTRGPARIDFDDRLIQGQTNKSGSVYLYDRKELKVRSMIKKRETFREEIVGTLFDDAQ